MMKRNLKLHIQKQNLVEKTETIVIALSGGIDSMVLFNILYELDINIVVGHINHKKRQESEMEYNEIKLMCEHKNVPFEGLEITNQINGNFQEEARNIRFDFFEEIARKYNANKIILAHHLDDQIETILMRIVRGSSFSGYSGIKSAREHNGFLYLRPLIDVPKEDIIQYAKDNNITYFEDVSNKENVYTRNRYRNHIIPLLKEENPHLDTKIKQFSEYMNMADEFINKQRDVFLNTYFINGEVQLVPFNNLDDILKIKVLKFIINSKTFDSIEISYKQYEDMIELLNNDNPNIKYNLSSGFVMIKVYKTFYIEKDIDKESVFIEINDVGEYIISQDIRYIFSYEKLGINHTDSFEIWYNEVVFPLYLRNRRNGDKISLQVGTKKVKDILIDQKVPQKDRENLILLATRDKVLWIPNIKKSLQDISCRKKLFVYEVK